MVERHFSCKPLVIGYETCKDVLPIAIDHPETTGPDLIAGCVGGQALHACPCIVVDMGTATTLVVLDKEGAMVGGAIVPGMGISLDALTQRAALLSSVSLDPPAHVGGQGHCGVFAVRRVVRGCRYAGRPVRPHGGGVGLSLPGDRHRRACRMVVSTAAGK